MNAQAKSPRVPDTDPCPFTVRQAAFEASTREQVVETIKRDYLFPWWESDDPYVVFEKQLREPFLLVDFGRLVEAAGLVLGREVAPHEFFHSQRLLDEFDDLRRRVHELRLNTNTLDAGE